jgi:hypothetical protein
MKYSVEQNIFYNNFGDYNTNTKYSLTLFVATVQEMAYLTIEHVFITITWF